jgi:hypothetical protein
MIEQIGNYVKINNKMIPAGNIQVEGYPKWVEHSDGEEVWYGIYFEIAFEDGALWIVERHSDAQFALGDNCDMICVATHDKFGMDRKADIPDHGWLLENWDMFLLLYRTKIRTMDIRVVV